MKIIKRQIVLWSCLTFFILPLLEAKEATDSNHLDESAFNFSVLRYAKYYLLNGNLKLAKLHLRNFYNKSNKLLLVKYRYQAIISFIEGNFEKSLAFVSEDKFNNEFTYPSICMLRLANFMAMQDLISTLRERIYCKEKTALYNNHDQFWLNHLLEIKITKGSNRYLNSNSDLIFNRIQRDGLIPMKIWMKLLLSIGREEIIDNNLGKLPSFVYKSKKVRELIALTKHLRNEDQEAWKLLEEVDSFNADNIRGNIYSRQKKYNEAYSSFKAALDKKQNSLNALKRAIALAWMLNKDQDGLNLLSDLTRFDISQNKKSFLSAAFYIRKENFIKADRQLKALELEFKKKIPPTGDAYEKLCGIEIARYGKTKKRHHSRMLPLRWPRLLDGHSANSLEKHRPYYRKKGKNPTKFLHGRVKEKGSCQTSARKYHY